MADEPTMRVPLRICMQCGKPIVAGMKECFSCGAPVDEEGKFDDQLRRCQTCGKDLVRGAIVCSLCGTRLRPERPAASAPPPASPPRPTPVPLTTIESSAPFPSLDKRPFLGIPKRIGLRLGTLIFLLLGFLGGKVLVRHLPSEPLTKEHPILPPTAEQVDTPPSPALLSVPVSETFPTPALPKGKVVTADGLTDIRVFGLGANAPERTVTVLRERVEEFLPSIQSMYSEKLMTTQQLLGTIILELVVTPEGRVSQVETHTTGLEAPEFLRMVQSLAQEWQFAPAAAGATTIFYPLLFMPTELDPFSLIGLTKELMPGRYRMVGGSATPVRLHPTDDEREVGRVSPGRGVDVVGSQKGWLTILSPKGKVGYIRREALLSRVEDEHPVS